MSFITKRCFPPATFCYNCKRKNRAGTREKLDKNKEYKRCAGCHFLTYCDGDCQREHWDKVHKNHCRFLSGKKEVDNRAPARGATGNCLANSNCKPKSCHCCLFCIEEKSGDASELNKINSPNTKCHVGDMINELKTVLGVKFGLHDEGKSCTCESDIPNVKQHGIEILSVYLNIPFPLGEVSGKYVHEIEEMVAHAIKIANAFKNKTSGNNQTLEELNMDLLGYRVDLWLDILTKGVLTGVGASKLSEHVNSLKMVYGPRNAWWKSLAATVDNVVDMTVSLDSYFIDCDSLKDKRFKNFKQMLDYDRFQMKNIEFTSKNNLLSNFKFWPVLARKSLITILPEGSKCHSCGKAQSGEVRISDQETNERLSRLHPGFGPNGALLVLCPHNDNCTIVMCAKNLRLQVQLVRDTKKPYKDQRKMFLTECRDCDFCLRQSLSSHRCSGCLAAQYCSTRCQKKDSAFHATVCSAWAKDPYRKIMGAKEQKKLHKDFLDRYYDEVFK